LSGNPKTGGASECDRRTADFAIDVGTGTVAASIDEGFALARAGLHDRHWTVSVGAAADASIGTRPHLAPLCIESVKRQTLRAKCVRRV
jgi:hypothetical protein